MPRSRRESSSPTQLIEVCVMPGDNGIHRRMSPSQGGAPGGHRPTSIVVYTHVDYQTFGPDTQDCVGVSQARARPRNRGQTPISGVGATGANSEVDRYRDPESGEM